jgi:hypothetical protein
MANWKKALLIILIISGCKKAFTPTGLVSVNNQYLVIEGTINSGNDTTFIKLSRTKKVDSSLTFTKETNANVTLENDASGQYPLTEITPGTYFLTGLTLDVARKYRLRIVTSNSKQYLSDYVEVKNAPPIDSVGFKAQTSGVQIYVNTHDNSNNTKYYRWEFSEAWKFHSYYESYWDGYSPRLYNYVYFCYSNDVSSSIVTATSAKLTNDVIYQAPVANIPLTSDKIQIRYSILVKQYALTSDAYSFWQNLQKNTSGLGSIFDTQPSLNQTNYHSLSDPSEIVVGYLSAGDYTTKRIFIDSAQLKPGYIETNPFGCIVDTVNINKPKPGDPNLADPRSGYTTIEGYYIVPLGPFGTPSEFTYSLTQCDDCTVRGGLAPPSFWK